MKGILDLFKKSGLILGGYRLFFRSFRHLLNYFTTLIWKINGVKIGKNSIIQFGVHIEYPKLLKIGSNCLLCKGTRITSENGEYSIILEDNVQVNSNVLLDHTGKLYIKSGTLISESAMIYTHSHGYDPRSKPNVSHLNIGKQVWIGVNSIVMPKIEIINDCSIIGAGAIVTKSVLKGEIVIGNSAKSLKVNPLLEVEKNYEK